MSATAGGPSRRALLGYGAAVLGGAGLGVAGRQLAVDGSGTPVADSSATASAVHGGRTIAFHGEHQAGITTPPQAYAAFVAFDLTSQPDPAAAKEALRRLLMLWTDDAERLTVGKPTLGDTEPELALAPARLTITVGLGPQAVVSAGATAPDWLGPLPAFPAIDRLEARWSDGDVLLHIGSDDQVTLSHTVRMMVKDARTFATVRWVQHGFRRAVGTETEGLTMRNLMGQVDGTQQPPSDEHDRLLWCSSPDWLRGGTSLVIRRVRFDMDDWDALDRPAKEEVIGRRLDTGAPLTGTKENDPVDLTAKNPGGLPVIPEFAHIRRAKTGDPRHQFLRRGYNYDVPVGSSAAGKGAVSDNGTECGLIFTAYQADVAAQFVPVQQALAEMDLLNTWTIPIGSSVFALLPGCREGEHLGQALFT